MANVLAGSWSSTDRNGAKRGKAAAHVARDYSSGKRVKYADAWRVIVAAEESGEALTVGSVVYQFTRA
jgi:hypothetical protein